MLLRLFTGERWSTAEEFGDYEFDALPGLGDTLAIASDREWLVGEVRALVHRLTDGDEAADVALLLGAARTAPNRGEPLPLALLDGTAPPKPAANVPRAGPWGS